MSYRPILNDPVHQNVASSCFDCAPDTLGGVLDEGHSLETWGGGRERVKVMV